MGSSALGAAALARNVADHRRAPVAAIVAGLGLADVVTEALGGWFVFGAGNVVRDVLARDRFIFESPDSVALRLILVEVGERIGLLVGHSKGTTASPEP